MDLPLRALALVLEEELGRLTALLRRLRTLHDVVVLGLAHRPPLVISDVVIQDEFTHDVVLPLAPDRFLVFDTT